MLRSLELANRFSFVFLIPLTVSALLFQGAFAQITVNSLDDDGAGGDCELREAIINANNDDQSGSGDCAAGSATDFLDLSGLVGTITLQQGELVIHSSMTIHGSGAATLTVDANQLSRVFSIPDSLAVPIVTIDGLTITGGVAVTSPAPNDNGGGIYNRGTLTLNDCVVTGNLASFGAGIHNAAPGARPSRGILNINRTTISNNVDPDTVFGNGGGLNNNVGGIATIVGSTFSGNSSNIGAGIYNAHEVSMINSTMSGNSTTTAGGGIYTSVGLIANNGVTISNSTITNNTANSGGGIQIAVTNKPDTAKVTLFSSIVAGNTATGSPPGPDIRGPVTTTSGFNFIGDSTGNGMVDGFLNDQVGTNALPINPQLGSLQSSSPASHPPATGSPVIDKGSCTNGIIIDQRGQVRPQDLPDGTYPNAIDGCDIGSVELLEAELPVELTDFVVVVEEDQIVLTWSTASESDNAGFELEHGLDGVPYRSIGFVDGHGTTSEPQTYRFVTEHPEPGLNRFRLKQIDFDGGFDYSPVVEVFVGLPDRFVLSDAYPNPFNPSTTFSLLVASDQRVQVELFDATGRLVNSLVNRTVAQNERLRVTIDGSDLPSGTYFYRAVGDFFASDVKKVTLVR